MQKHTIPKENTDLASYAFWHSFQRIALYIAYIALWGAGYWVYLEIKPLAEPFAWWVMLIFVLAVLISGFIIFRVDKLFTLRNQTLRITGKKYTRDWGRGKTRRGTTAVDYHTYVVFIAENGKGKKRRIRLQLFDDGYDLYYKEGDTIVSFRGLNYPISLESEARGEHICTVCGVRKYQRRNAMGEVVNNSYVCESCGRSLINIADLNK